MPSNFSSYRFSVVIPTYQRKDLLLTTLESLAKQDYERPFEVICVIDGSTDGTSQTLYSKKFPFKLMVLEQENQGAGTARNNGAQKADGEILVFLDDDMEACPEFLTELDQSFSHPEFTVVTGDILLDPKSPKNPLTSFLDTYSKERIARLKNGQEINEVDIWSGQLAIRKHIFFKYGGFDGEFNIDGQYGNEDMELGLRLIRGGEKIAYNSEVKSYQYYEPEVKQHLRRGRDQAYTDLLYVRKYPLQRFRYLLSRDKSKLHFLIKLIAGIPLLSGLISFLLFILLKLFFWLNVWTGPIKRLPFGSYLIEYEKGIKTALKELNYQPIKVLVYNSFASSSSADIPIISKYRVKPKDFLWHTRLLKSFGFNIISPKDFIANIYSGLPLPKNPVLITFDVGFKDMADILQELKADKITGVIFTNNELIGEFKTYERLKKAREAPVLNASDLQAFQAIGWSIGVQDSTLPYPYNGSVKALQETIESAVDELSTLVSESPSFYTYTHKNSIIVTEETLIKKGIKVAFTKKAGKVKYTSNLFQLPRIHIKYNDRLKLLLKLLLR